MFSTGGEGSEDRLQGERCTRALRRCEWRGRSFTEEELRWITSLVGSGAERNRTQLTDRVCEQLDWRRPTGALKSRECRDLLEGMERSGWFTLPPKQGGRPRGSRTGVPMTLDGEPREPLVGTVGEFGRLSVERVEKRADHRWFRELVGRYHYLGYRVPFGVSQFAAR